MDELKQYPQAAEILQQGVFSAQNRCCRQEIEFYQLSAKDQVAVLAMLYKESDPEARSHFVPLENEQLHQGICQLLMEDSIQTDKTNNNLRMPWLRAIQDYYWEWICEALSAFQQPSEPSWEDHPECYWNKAQAVFKEVAMRLKQKG